MSYAVFIITKISRRSKKDNAHAHFLIVFCLWMREISYYILYITVPVKIPYRIVSIKIYAISAVSVIPCLINKFRIQLLISVSPIFAFSSDIKVANLPNCMKAILRIQELLKSLAKLSVKTHCK